MTDNARHGEQQTPPSVSYLWAGAKKSATINDSGIRCRGTHLLAEMERLNIPLHTTFYCFIKLLVNHAFTSFKPFHLFHISQAYIYNSALSCIIRVRKNSRLRPIKSPRRLVLIIFLKTLQHTNIKPFTKEIILTILALFQMALFYFQTRLCSKQGSSFCFQLSCKNDLLLI